MFYRRSGHFEAAIAMQRAADLLEAGGAALSTAHIDRGSSDGAWAYVDGDLVVVNSGDGAVAIAMTRDRAYWLFIGLALFLKVTPIEMLEMGHFVQETLSEERAR